MRRLLFAGLLAALAVLGLSSPAFAHNVLVGSDPTQGASLSTGPSVVRLDFNEPVQTGPNVITVTGPNNTRWERTENATVNGNSVSTTVAPLGPAGTYLIGYRIISADGHPVSGTVRFTLTVAGNGTPVGVAGATSSGSGGGGTPVWPWLVGAVVVLGVGLFVVLRRGGKAEAKRP